MTDKHALFGHKVVLSKEMSIIEKASFQNDLEKEEKFMLNAGAGIALAVEKYVAEQDLEKRCLLLVGKGNNGGDAFVCGAHLIKKGFLVDAIVSHPLSECSPLSQKMASSFMAQAKESEVIEKDAGKVLSYEQIKEDPFHNIPLDKGIIVDGLLGTGFKGELKEPLLSLIQAVNKLDLPVISIDIPSGVDGNTGQVITKAIEADLTVYLGLPKTGFFLSDGYQHVKHLAYVDFGLEKRYIDQAKEDFFLINEEKIKQTLPKISYDRHKYEAGYVLAVAGSSGMRGAACLSSLSALRTGCGMVRLFVSEHLKMHLPVEAVCSDRKEELILQEAKRAKAIYIGPGIGREVESKDLIQTLLPKLQIPLLLDADALYLIGTFNISIPKGSIVTPHHKEMCYLLSQEKIDEDEMFFFSKCQKYANEKKIIIVLKGAPTFIFSPDEKPLIIPRGDPGMASAGTGDVLTGIISSLLAQGLETFQAAALGVYIHSLAGEFAKEIKTSYSIIASDLIDAIPQVIAEIQRR